MDRSASLVLTSTRFMVLAILLGVTCTAPILRNQFITGTIVNAVLLLSVCLSGLRASLIIAIIPSGIALAVGLLPVILAPVIPFIILSNVILVVAFGLLKNRSYWSGAVIGAILKAGFLSLVIVLLIDQFMMDVPSGVAYMLSWPQLVTALTGSLLAWIVLHLTGWIKSRITSDNNQII